MFGNFCPGCGNIAPAGHEFCRHCGRHLNDSSTEVADGNGSRAAAATTTTAAIAEPVTLPHTDSITGAAPMMTDIGATADDGAPGSRRRRWVFFGVGGGAAVIIAAVGGWLLFGRDDSPQRTRRALAPIPGAVAAPLRSAATAKRLVEIQLAGRLASKAVER